MLLMLLSSWVTQGGFLRCKLLVFLAVAQDDGILTVHGHGEEPSIQCVQSVSWSADIYKVLQATWVLLLIIIFTPHQRGEMSFLKEQFLF